MYVPPYFQMIDHYYLWLLCINMINIQSSCRTVTLPTLSHPNRQFCSYIPSCSLVNVGCLEWIERKGGNLFSYSYIQYSIVMA